MQEAVIATLQKLGAKVCVVGDDDQTLYQWRGSDVSNILSFNTRYPDVTRAQMEENFRSTAKAWSQLPAKLINASHGAPTPRR